MDIYYPFFPIFQRRTFFIFRGDFKPCIEKLKLQKNPCGNDNYQNIKTGIEQKPVCNIKFDNNINAALQIIGPKVMDVCT